MTEMNIEQMNTEQGTDEVSRSHTSIFTICK
jgi:hypothetical protein